MPSKGKAASPLHATLLLRLRRLFEDREVSIKVGMKEAGASEQLYQQWQHGASPKLITVEAMAKNLETTVSDLLGLAPPKSALVPYAEALTDEATPATTMSLMRAIEMWADAAGVKRPTEDQEFFDGLVVLWRRHRRRAAR